MSHRVVMIHPSVAAVPETVRDEARRRFAEIAEGVGGIPAESAFWHSVRVSRLCLVVGGWSFFYTLDDRTLRVTEVRAAK